MSESENTLTHFNQQGEAHMVDIGNKDITKRIAVTEGRILMKAKTLQHILEGNNKKGDVLGIARIAGIMGAKKTPDLIPLCHPLSLTHVDISLETQQEPPAVYCKTEVATSGKTGVEMEALNATQVALLTIYDMCKAVDKGMVIDGVRLLKKTGGKSGTWEVDS